MNEVIRHRQPSVIFLSEALSRPPVREANAAAESRGTPIASIANLIGAQLFLMSGAPAGPFWKKFTAVSVALLAAMTAFGLLLLTIRGAP